MSQLCPCLPNAAPSGLADHVSCERHIRHGADEVHSGVVAGVGTTKEVKDECGVWNGLLDGAKGIGSFLHLCHSQQQTSP